MNSEYKIEFGENNKEYKEGLESNPNLFNEIIDELLLYIIHHHFKPIL